ncbi:hypothetical protein CBEIBR21_06485 [Clostridium beijerinckii]|uniref:Uncharacterized protein n=2 Tax=Clostridium beijerinckii TaxID=1520 RepID=A0A1S9N9R7_CLOBE|nr:hypothetical protein CBEIBR21_06485 [Clostridium beijerinckii]
MKKLIEGDIDLYTYAHYINKKGLSLEELEQSSGLARMFYTASMLVMKKEQMENDIALARLSNPFLEKKK